MSRCSLTYVLSFVFLGIYWNNHHHLLQATRRVNGADAVGQPAPAVLALAGPVRHRLDGREPLRAAARPPRTASCCSWPASPTTSSRRRSSPRRATTSTLAAAVGRDLKGKISPVIYAVAIPLAFVNRWIARRALRRWSRSCGWCPTGASSHGSPRRRFTTNSSSRRARARRPARRRCRAPSRSGYRCTTSACPRNKPERTVAAHGLALRGDVDVALARRPTPRRDRRARRTSRATRASCERHLVDDHVDSRPRDLPDRTAVRAHQPPRVLADVEIRVVAVAFEADTVSGERTDPRCRPRPTARAASRGSRRAR